MARPVLSLLAAALLLHSALSAESHHHQKDLKPLVKTDSSPIHPFHHALKTGSMTEPEGNPDPRQEQTEEELPPLFPMSTHTLIGVTVAALGLIIAAGGGIGGGGVLVPVFIMVCGFPAKLAIPLSNVTIFGGAISNCYLNLQKRHPSPTVDRPLVDFDLVNVMEPLTIAGAVVGSLMNKLLPGWIITLMLVVVLGATGVKTMMTGRKRWNKESAELERANSGGVADGTVVKMQSYGATTDASATTDLSKMDTQQLRKLAREYGAEERAINLAWDTAELIQIIKAAKDPEGHPEKSRAIEHEYEMLIQEEAQIPYNKILFLVICFLGVISFGLLRGDTEGHGPLGLTCGSFWYMVLLLAPLPYVLVLALYQRNVLIEQHEKKIRLNYYERNPVEGDIQWDNNTTIVYPLICSLAGVFAGLFGIGGGIVKGPLMLEMGIDPQVSSGTAAFMILFTAGAASVSFALFGLLQLDYAIFFWIFGLVFTYGGQIFCNWAIAKGGRSSIIIFIVAAIILVSTMLMGVEGYNSAHETWKHHTTAHLGLCGGSGGGE